jgi:hypothetical protein
MKVGFAVIDAFGVSGDPTYTHSRKVFGKLKSPEAVYSGRYRALVVAATFEDCCANALGTITPPQLTPQLPLDRGNSWIRTALVARAVPRGAAQVFSAGVRSSARAGFLRTTGRVGAPHHYSSDALVGPKLGGR